MSLIGSPALPNTRDKCLAEMWHRDAHHSTRAGAARLALVVWVTVSACVHPAADPRTQPFVRGCDPDRRLAPSEVPLTGIATRVHLREIELMRAIPGGFAGFDEDSGTWRIALVSLGASDAARTALLRLYDEGSLNLGPTRRDIERAVPRQVMWSLPELHDWMQFLSPRVFAAAPPATGIGINEQGNTITVVVRDDRRGVERVLRELRVPCRLIVQEVGGGLTAPPSSPP